MLREELLNRFKKMKLGYLVNNLDDFVAEMSAAKTDPISILSTMIEREIDNQGQKTLERRIQYSKLNVKELKFMADFDWSWPKGLDRDLTEELLGLSFMQESANIIFSGTEGLGKSMIAKNIGYQAVMRGYSVLFVETSRMLSELAGQDSPRLLNNCLKRYTTPSLLILDEWGYLSYDNQAADLLFEIVNRRYQKGSIILTTNMAFTEWPTVFPGAACIRAMIDRLIHRSEIITITGESYRLKEANERQEKKRKSKKQKNKRKK